jgi:hypothetical protein
MRSFIIRMSTGEYLTKVRIISNYLEYEFTMERDPHPDWISIRNSC